MRGVVFDLFHTLVDPEDFRPRDSWRLRHVAETIDANGRDLVMFWKDTYLERTTSPVSGTDLILRYAADNGVEVSDAQVAEISGHLGDYQDTALERPRPDVQEAVASMADARELALLSNCYIEEVAAWPRSPLAPHFAGAAFSYAIGFRKPDRDAYLAATGLLGLGPEDCAFIRQRRKQRARRRKSSRIWARRPPEPVQREQCPRHRRGTAPKGRSGRRADHRPRRTRTTTRLRAVLPAPAPPVLAADP